jgi:hypothetical protein
MRFNEDWLINQYEIRIQTYKDMLSIFKDENCQITKYKALIVATEEFIKDLKELKEIENV